MSILKLYDFPMLGDGRGSQVALSQSYGVPFGIKRAYYIFGTAIRNCWLESASVVSRLPEMGKSRYADYLYEFVKLII